MSNIRLIIKKALEYFYMNDSKYLVLYKRGSLLPALLPRLLKKFA